MNSRRFTERHPLLVNGIISILVTLSALIITVLIALEIETIKNPVFGERLEEYSSPAGQYYRVLVRNKPVSENTPRPFNRLRRSMAVNTQARLTFYKNFASDSNRPLLYYPVAGRWSNQPEPVTPNQNKKPGDGDTVYDESKALIATRQDIPAGIEEPLDIAAKISGYSSPINWSNDFYAHLKPPLVFSAGRYNVKIELYSGEVYYVFWLNITSDGQNLKIELAKPPKNAGHKRGNPITP